MNTFQNTVLSWYETHKRDLPWRKTEDPYKILISEFMLQQTQVNRVIEKYNLFTQRYPTVQDFAAATPAEIIILWEGLGYNRRALYLLKTMQLIVSEWNQKIPNDPKLLQKCPGIGPYTAAAICSFAFNKDISVIDINILRIMERYFYGEPKDKQIIEQTTIKQLPKSKSREWHNALMDFGAMICTDKPNCIRCPLRSSCKGFKKGALYSKPPKQSTFKNSDRYYRGKIIRQLRTKTATAKELFAVCKAKGLQDKKRFNSIIEKLKKEQMIKGSQKKYSLPS